MWHSIRPRPSLKSDSPTGWVRRSEAFSARGCFHDVVLHAPLDPEPFGTQVCGLPRAGAEQYPLRCACIHTQDCVQIFGEDVHGCIEDPSALRSPPQRTVQLGFPPLNVSGSYSNDLPVPHAGCTHAAGPVQVDIPSSATVSPYPQHVIDRALGIHQHPSRLRCQNAE